MVWTLEDTIKGQVENHTNAHFMMIDGMSKLMSGKVVTCRSSDFHASGLKWKLYIGSKDAEENYLPFRVAIADTKEFGVSWSVKCRVTLSMVSYTGHHYLCISFMACFKGNGDRKGFNNSISYEVLKKCVVNDKGVFCIKITDVEASFHVTHHIPHVVVTAEIIKPFEVHRCDARFTWKITKFSSFNCPHHSSYEFAFGPRKWKIVMYPNGSLKGDGYLSLYLTATDYVTSCPKRLPTFAEYKLRVLDQGPNRNHHETCHEAWFFGGKHPQSVGRSKFMSLKELHNASNGYLVDDEIYIGVEFLAISTAENL